MTLFSKTVSQLDEIEKGVNAEKEVDRTSTSAIEQKINLSALSEELNSIRPTADKLKKNADETDAEKKVYGPGMVKKVLAFYERFLEIDASLSEILDKVSAEAKTEQAAIDERKAQEEAREAAALLKLAEENEMKAAALEASRLAEEVKLKAAADAAAKHKAEAEAAEAAKKQAEAAKRAEEEALAAAKKAEDEALKLAEALKVAAATATKKAEEDDTAKKAQEAAAAAAAAQKAEEEAAAVAAQKKTEEEAKGNAMPPVSASQSLEEQARVAAAALSAALSAGVGDLATGAATSGEAFARGQVKVITQGAEELRQQLDGAANDLVIVDWNASWCGPCQRIKPEFEKLAQKYTTCLFLSIDIQASPANQAVASQAAVRSLPTFHFYRASMRLEEFTGASLPKLEDTIQRLTGGPAEPPAAASPPTQAPMPSSDELIAAVGEALGALKSACSFDDFVVATRTLLTFIGNVLKHPADPKFRRVRLSNPSFQSRLGSRTGGIECMCAFGFERVTENDEQILILSEAAAKNPALATVKSLLEQAVPQAPTPTPAAAVPPPPMGLGGADPLGLGLLGQMPGGGMPGGLGQMPGGMPPGGMAEMMQQMAQNPEMMQQMANNPMLQQMLPPHMQQQMQQMLANPEMMQQMLSNPMVTQMLNNPQMMQQMQQDMANLFGGAGAPGVGGATPGLPDIFVMLGGAGGMGAGGVNPFGNATERPPSTTPAPTPGAPPTANPPSTTNMGRSPTATPGTEPATGMTDEEMLAEAIRRSLEENPQAPP